MAQLSTLAYVSKTFPFHLFIKCKSSTLLKKYNYMVILVYLLNSDLNVKRKQELRNELCYILTLPVL